MGFGYAFSPMTSPVTSPITSPDGSPGAVGNTTRGAMVPSTAMNADPFGVNEGQQLPPTLPKVAAQAANALDIVPSAAPPCDDPFGVFGGQPSAPSPANVGPYSSSALAPTPATQGGTVDDPFGIFGTPTPVPAALALVQAQAPAQQPASQAPTAASTEEHLWAAAGFGNETASPEQPITQSVPEQHASSTSVNFADDSTATTTNKKEEMPIIPDSNGLPSEGGYYEARINVRSLGAMFYTSHNLEGTLYRKMPQNVVKALASRPVVAYVADNSAAHNSGIQLGHIILSVNGHEATDPEACASMIRNAARPMNLRCYVPPAMELTISDGRHMVKYDTKDVEAPRSSGEWKRKFVVVGGIVTKPWMMNMFYRKKDYDVAVKEAHAGNKISVKVKQFDLRCARIVLKGGDGKPNWIGYPTERKPWYYITVLPNKGYPIKISSTSLEELEPVYSAIRRFVKKDMESNYQLQVEQSFGDGMGGRRGRDERSKSGGFDQFNDAPRHQVRPDSYWH